MSFHTCCLMTPLLLLVAQPASAALVITIEPSSTSLVEGQSGTIDILAYSTNSPNDLLDSFLLGVNITGGTGIVFRNPQSEAFLSDPNYVFFNRSSNVAESMTSFVSLAGDEATIGDVSYNFTSQPAGDSHPFAIPSLGSPSLLARLQFDAISPGTFNFSIDSASSFSDENFDLFDFSATGASFTVTAVPEPSSLAVLLVAAAGSGALQLRRKRLAASKVSMESAKAS
jgi:hypothetical protein